jgi:sulfur relay (sulfurtransferase) complex TusBCD TusD component (DsrE family)
MAAAPTLAIVVSTWGRGDLPTAFALAAAARAGGLEVGMFFMSDAVRELPLARRHVAALADDGCELWACAQSCFGAGLNASDVGMTLGSQDDHAALVHRAHRVVAFT